MLRADFTHLHRDLFSQGFRIFGCGSGQDQGILEFSKTHTVELVQGEAGV